MISLILNIYYYILFLPCIMQTTGKRENLPRYIIEDVINRPIFGSYSYDPIKQVFEVDAQQNKTIAIQVKVLNETYSTAGPPIVRNRPLMARSRYFRKHVSMTTRASAPVSRPNINNWWSRHKLLLQNASTHQ